MARETCSFSAEANQLREPADRFVKTRTSVNIFEHFTYRAPATLSLSLSLSLSLFLSALAWDTRVSYEYALTDRAMGHKSGMPGLAPRNEPGRSSSRSYASAVIASLVMRGTAIRASNIPLRTETLE